MFTVGEFSRIAQVSRRLLRYYDEIGILKPMHIDPDTGYRYYSADQMPYLNRILALKDLGLSLEQIQRIVKDNVTTDELHGMLLLKKAEVEQQLLAEMQRMRKIESRIQALRHSEAQTIPHVVLKQAPAQLVISLRTVIDSFEEGLALFGRITRALPQKGIAGFRFCICHSDGLTDREMDLELGYFLEEPLHKALAFYDGLPLRVRELPAIPIMATCVVKGSLEHIHTGYTGIAHWAETNGYRFSDIPREITLQIPQTADGSDLITEIQVPVEPVLSTGLNE